MRSRSGREPGAKGPRVPQRACIRDGETRGFPIRQPRPPVNTPKSSNTPPRSASASPASLWLRLTAIVYDLLPLVALWFIAAVLALVLTGGALDVRRFADKVLVQALVLVFSALYFVVSWTRGGQTIGMRPWKLRIVRSNGGAPSWRQSLLRFVLAIASLAALGLGFWWALFDAQSRTWHDRATGTMMVRMERET